MIVEDLQDKIVKSILAREAGVGDAPCNGSESGSTDLDMEPVQMSIFGNGGRKGDGEFAIT